MYPARERDDITDVIDLIGAEVANLGEQPLKGVEKVRYVLHLEAFSVRHPTGGEVVVPHLDQSWPGTRAICENTAYLHRVHCLRHFVDLEWWISHTGRRLSQALDA